MPGTPWRIGVDPLVGLVPGIGDALGAVVSAVVLVQAAQWGAPGPVLLRMLANIALDATIGSIPVLGDVFDAAWKANLKNVDLLERYLADPAGVHRGSARLVVALIVAIIALVCGALALSLLVLRAGLHILAR